MAYRSHRNSGTLLLSLISAALVVTLGGMGAFLFFLYEGSTDGTSKEIIIPYKTSLRQVAEILHKENVIRRPWFFRTLMRFTRGASYVRAGEFRFTEDMRPVRALYTLYFEEPVLHRVSIPEGWTIKQIAQLLAKEKLVDEKKFIELALNPTTATRYKLKVPHLEGFLFPETYSFSKVEGEEKILDRMVQTFFSKFSPEIREAAKAYNFSLEEVVTLASIVEKETGAPEERVLISSVFHNRLKKKMRLQSDPTTIYGIVNFNGNLKRDDLKRYSAYNTYVIPALPPGPIASPGEAALRAAVFPATTKFLYFVSNNSGHHIFSETYTQHSRHVNNFQVRHRAPSSPKAN